MHNHTEGQHEMRGELHLICSLPQPSRFPDYNEVTFGSYKWGHMFCFYWCRNFIFIL